MTLTFCDICGKEIDLDGPKPTHFRLTLAHYEPSIAWDKDSIHWQHVCVPCSTELEKTLLYFQESRS